MVVFPGVEPEHPVAGTVIERGVVVRHSPSDRHQLHVHLDRVAWRGCLKEVQLAGPPLAKPRQAGDAQPPEGLLEHAGRDADLVHARQPELGAGRPIPELEAGLTDQCEHLGGQA